MFTGCLVPSRLIGVIETEQTEDGKTTRNDRLIAVAEKSRDHSDVQTIADLNENTAAEIQGFFVAYNREQGRKFKIVGRDGAKRALKLLKKSIDRARREAA